MKKVITPAALKHILVPFFAFILIFCNSLNFIKANDVVTTGAMITSYTDDNGYYYTIDINMGTESVYSDLYSKWLTYGTVNISVSCNELVNGEIGFTLTYLDYLENVYSDVYVTSTLSNGYGENSIQIQEIEDGNYFSALSISNVTVAISGITEISLDQEDLSDYEVSVDSAGLLTAVADTSYDTSTTKLNSSNYIGIQMSETLEDNCIYVIALPVGYSTERIGDTVSCWSKTTLSSTTSVALTFMNYYIDQGRYSSLLVFQPLITNNTSYFLCFNFATTGNLNVYSDTYKIYKIPYTSSIYELYMNEFYQRKVEDYLSTIIVDNDSIIEQLEISNSWLDSIADIVSNIYDFLTDDTDTAATDEIDDTVTSLQNASSTVESTQSDFTAQLTEYSSGIDLDDYSFDSTSGYTATNTYYKYIISEAYEATGDLKYLMILPLILAVFCFILGVV